MLKFKPATKRAFEKWRIRGRAGHTPSFREIWAIIADFCEKYKIFPKIFIIFTHFSNERNLSIAKGRSPIRARVRPRQYSVKKRMTRQQSDELEKTKTRAAGHGPATPPTPTFARVTPKGLWTRESSEARPEAHPPRARLPKLAFA